MEQVNRVNIDGKALELPVGAAFIEAVPAARAGSYTALGAVMGSKAYSLSEAIPGDGNISFLDITSEEGTRIYARSASFLLVRAVRELYEGARVLIDYSLNQCLYCELKWKRRLSAADLKAIEGRMHEIVGRDERFEPVEMPVGDARAAFLADGRADVAGLIPADGTYTAYRCGKMLDAWYGPLVPSAGYLKLFRLQFYLPGFLLMLPNSFSPGSIPQFMEMPKLSAVFNESAEWDRLIGVSSIADLNKTLRDGRGRALVRMCEVRQDGRIARIADVICRERKRVILIAGPSSSGKTTFAHRLMVHLQACGLAPMALSLDDYYLDRDKCPRCEDGTYDLESIDALNMALFEEQLSALLAGEEIELARFDFLTGRSGRAKEKISIKAGQPLIIEGINGLNNRLTRFIPANIRYRIFVSALTQLNIDDHNRVATTDVRLIRRIVRDNLTRGRDAQRTIEDWPSVHKAEFRNIFPNQENADVIFNSAMVYELAALRPVALPLLDAIPGSLPARMDADRLSALLSFVEPLPCMDEIPPTSIIREFVGGCTFYQ